MRKHLFLLISACLLLSAMLTGCSSGHQFFSHSSSSGGASKSQSSVTGNQPKKNTPTLHQAKQAINPETASSETVTSTPSVSPDEKTILEKRFEKVSAIKAPKPSDTLTPDVAFFHPDSSLTSNGTGLVNKQAGEKYNSKIVPPAATTKSNPVIMDALPMASGLTGSAALKEINPAPASEIEGEMPDISRAAPGENTEELINKYAGMINVESKEINNYPLYRFIDQWYGTEYRFGGTDINGIDCSAFSQKLYDQVYGIELLRTTREQRHNSEKVKYFDDALQGDLVFFRIHRFRISHVGVYLANGYFVHASSSQGVVISNLNNKYWRRRFAGCGRVAKEEHASESDNIP